MKVKLADPITIKLKPQLAFSKLKPVASKAGTPHLTVDFSPGSPLFQRLRKITTLDSYVAMETNLPYLHRLYSASTRKHIQFSSELFRKLLESTSLYTLPVTQLLAPDRIRNLPSRHKSIFQILRVCRFSCAHI